jgi:Rrf2 family protein
MDVSRRTDYAIRMMMQLAEDPSAGPLSVRKLSEEQDVPYPFARGIQRDLVASGLVRSTRGVAGGIELARDASAVTLLDIIEATQGEVSSAVCTSDPNWCGRMGSCGVHGVWKGADDVLRAYFKERTLASLVGDNGK